MINLQARKMKSDMSCWKKLDKYLFIDFTVCVVSTFFLKIKKKSFSLLYPSLDGILFSSFFARFRKKHGKCEIFNPKGENIL